MSSAAHVRICALFLLLASSAFGEKATIDLQAWDGVTTKTEDGWTLTDISKYAPDTLKGAAYFGKNSAKISSPTFVRPILEVRVESATTSDEIKRDLSLVPYVGGKKSDPILLKRPTGKTFVEERIDLSSRESESFDLELSGTSGNWAVRKITVIYGEYEPEVVPVDGVTITGSGTDAFTLGWEPVTDAVGYVVDVRTNEDVFVHRDVVVTGCSFSCSAQPALYECSVKARFVVHGETVDSAAVTSRVDMANPPWLRCWKLSEFLPRPGCRSADFSGLGEIKTQTAWTNGVDGDFFYAFKNADPASIIRPATDKSVYGDLYCYNAGTSATPTNGLALLGADKVAMRLILPIRLDTERRIERLAVSFAVREVKVGTADATTMSFAYATVDDIQTMAGDDVVWTDVPSAAFVTTNKTGLMSFDFPVADLRTARNLCLRWSVPNRANSSMLGLSDIKVSGKIRSGMVIFIR